MMLVGVAILRIGLSLRATSQRQDLFCQPKLFRGRTIVYSRLADRLHEFIDSLRYCDQIIGRDRALPTRYGLWIELWITQSPRSAP